MQKSKSAADLKYTGIPHQSGLILENLVRTTQLLLRFPVPDTFLRFETESTVVHISTGSLHRLETHLDFVVSHPTRSNMFLS